MGGSHTIGTIGGYRGGSRGSGPPPFLSTKNSIAIACQRGIKALSGNNTRSTLSLTANGFFSSSPTFSDIDLAHAIYMQGSKLRYLTHSPG